MIKYAVGGRTHTRGCDTHGRDAVSQRVRGLLFASVMGLMVLAVGCGGSGAEATGDSNGTVQTSDASAPVGQAGRGEVSAGGVFGSPDFPLDYVQVFPTSFALVEAGGINLAAYDTCGVLDKMNHDKPIRKQITQGGTPGIAYENIAVYNKSRSSIAVTGTLVCSSSNTAINPLTTGPGPSGISVPCPSNMKVFPGSANANFKRPNVSASDGGLLQDGITFSAGSYGYNNDGLWNYWFHNWKPEAVVPTLWVMCVPK